MQADVRETIAQVRDLAHGIYPPLLRQAGLPEALRAAATRSPNAVTVELAGVDGRQEPDVEAALYFCALEALQNIAKHAPDAAATVRLGATGGAARARGRRTTGPATTRARDAAGQGRQNMTDRVGAVGGAVRVDTVPGRGHGRAGRGAGAGAGRLMAGRPVPGRGVPWAAVRAVARVELRTRWRSLVVVGLLAGLVAGVVAAAAAVAQPDGHGVRPAGRGHATSTTAGC